MSEILQDLSTPALVRAIEANLFETWAYSGRWPQAELYDGLDMMRFITGVPFPWCNGVFRAHLAPEETDAKIAATLTHFKARHLPLIWWTGPSTRPADLGERLQAHGLKHAEDAPGMAMDLRALTGDLPTPSGLTIAPVGDVETLGRWLRPFTLGFEFPDFAANAFFDCYVSLGFSQQGPLRHYIGWLKGEAVATSSLFLGAGVAGIYNVAAVPEVRRQGIGLAMTSTPLRIARDLGYRVGILHSSQMGFNVYRRLGFQEYCKVSQYVWTSETEHGEGKGNGA
jgi:ribosomal protein S18 acetylase RimI-like enzyme